jgi:hypothetical protein
VLSRFSAWLGWLLSDIDVLNQQRALLVNRVLKLKSQGIRFSQRFLNECQWYDFSRDPSRYFSINSTLSLAEKLRTDSNCNDIEVESESDISAYLDKKKIVFELKSLYSLATNYHRKVIDYWTKRFYDEILTKNGLFAKVIFLPSPTHTIQPHIIERRKVSQILEASFGVLYFSLDVLSSWTYGRVKGALRKSYGQLKKSSALYRVAVIDMRYEGINEIDAYEYILRILHGKKYNDLSGVMLMTFDIRAKSYTTGTKLILISNPYAEKTINSQLLFKNPKQTLSYEKRYMLVMPTRIRIHKPGWHDWIQIEPGYRIIHKGVEYGTL